MSGTMRIRGDVAWMPASWVFDNVLELVASELDAQDPALSKALLEARTETSSGYIDLTTLAPDRFRLLVAAVTGAFDRVVAEGSAAFHDPSFYDGFVKRFGELKAALESDARAGSSSP